MAYGLALAIPPGYASPVFPAPGFGLAIVLLHGRGKLLGVGLGSLALNLGVALYHGNFSNATILVAAGIATGAMLQAWFGQTLIQRKLTGQWQSHPQERDLVTLLLLGGPVACLVSASVGVFTLFTSGILPPGATGYAWWTWFVGDTLGVLLAAPLVAGENLGEGQKSFDEVLQDWLNSYSHCTMLMNPKVNEMPVAKIDKYWVQHFGKPMPQKP